MIYRQPRPLSHLFHGFASRLPTYILALSNVNYLVCILGRHTLLPEVPRGEYGLDDILVGFGREVFAAEEGVSCKAWVWTFGVSACFCVCFSD